MNKTIILVFVVGLVVWVYAAFGIYHVHVENSMFSPLRSAVNTSKTAGQYKVTAYCPGPCCCGKFADGITASGLQAVGKIVAAPKSIPFGTVLDIPGYGVCTVEDRGGAIKGNKLDVLFPTHQEALNWGVQELTVTFMENVK